MYVVSFRFFVGSFIILEMMGIAYLLSCMGQSYFLFSRWKFDFCHQEWGGEGSPTEQEVQDCMESSYTTGIDSNEDIPAASTNDGDEDENGVNEDVSTDDTEDDDEDDW